jgi:ABC-type Fe3+ transport system substrate-binding protein
MMTRLNQLGTALLMSTSVFGLAGQAMAQSSLNEVIQNARKEGEVVLDVGPARFPRNTGDNLAAAIGEEFGIDLKVKLINGPSAPVATGKIINEAQAGIKPSFDTTVLPLPYSEKLDGLGAVESIDWVGMGVTGDKISPSGNSVWTYSIPRAVIYNVDLVDGDDIPTRLEDLTDPKWKGKIAGPAFGGALAIAVVPIMGEEGGAEWLRTLYEDQDFATIPVITDIPNRVANGEFPIGFGLPANFTGLVDKGAPIKNATLEKVSGSPYYQFVGKDAEHPNAGALLAYFFCCTTKGMKALYEELNLAHYDTEGTETYEIAGDGRGVVPTADWQINESARVNKRFDELIGR